MVSWDDVFLLIKQVSPVLGNAIASKNPTGGMAINIISQTFGANKNDPEDILNKINADPEYHIKLKKIEFDHEEFLQNNNRTSSKRDGSTLFDWVPTFLAIGFLINYAAIQFYCVIHNGTETDIISARFQDVLIMIMSHYFWNTHNRKN